MFYRASSRQRIIAAAICLGVMVYFAAFAVAGRYNVDIGRHLGYCGFKQRTGLPCPTCGMTTATLAFAQGKIWDAFKTQPAAGLLYSMAVIAAITALFTAVSGLCLNSIRLFFKEVKARYIILALAIILASGWAVTLARALATKN